MAQTEDFPDTIKEKYEFVRIIGKGDFGTVYLVEDKSSIVEFALKVIETTDSQVPKDIKLLQRLNHPNLVKLYGSIFFKSKIFLTSEYIRGGSLRDRLKKNNGRLTPTTAKLYFYQMCKAVEYLHWNGIIHGNIRPENVLFVDDREFTQLKFSDYGLDLNPYSICMKLKTGNSSKYYVAPEILSSQGRDSCSTKIDIWSLGVVLYECLKGKYPSGNIGDNQRKSWNFRIRTWTRIPDSAKSTIETMLEANPNRRLNIEEVLLCFWLDDPEMKSIVQKLVENRTKRLLM